jgi:hypothetical protein
MSRQILVNLSNTLFYETPCDGSQIILSRQTDMLKLIDTFLKHFVKTDGEAKLKMKASKDIT